MEPFFSPLLREKVKSLFAEHLINAPILLDFINDNASKFASIDEEDITGCTEEIQYLTMSVIDEAALIQRYTPLSTSHAHQLYYSLWQLTRLHGGAGVDTEASVAYLKIVSKVAFSLLSQKYDDFTFWINLTGEHFCEPFPIPFYWKMGFDSEHEHLCQALDRYLAQTGRYSYGVYQAIHDLFIIDGVTEELQKQADKDNVVSWDAIIENIASVDSRSLDAIQSFCFNLARQHCQDPTNYRNNTEAVCQKVQERRQRENPIINNFNAPVGVVANEIKNQVIK